MSTEAEAFTVIYTTLMLPPIGADIHEQQQSEFMKEQVAKRFAGELVAALKKANLLRVG